MGVGSGKALKTLVALLRRGIVKSGDANEMLALLRTLFRASGVVMASEFSYQGWLEVSGDLGDWPEVYTSLAHTDSTIEEICASAPGDWFFVQRADPHHRQTAVHEAFVDQGFGDVAIARLPSTQRDHVTIGLYRSRGDGDYDEDDETLLSLLSPLLARSLASKTARAALNRSASTEDMQQALEAVDGWAYVTFPGGAVTWSPSAQRLWQSKLGAIGSRGWTRIEAALRWAVEHGAYTTSDAVRATRLIRDIAVELAYVPPRPGETHRVLALFFADPEPVPDALDAAPRTAAEAMLSEQQRVVARFVAYGYSLPRVARELSISLETARDYLKTVYQRLGVDNRVELARLLR